MTESSFDSSQHARLPLRFLPMVWASLVAGGLIGFVAKAVMARTLEVDAFGSIALVLAAAAILTPWAAFGIGLFWLQVFGREGDRAVRWITPSLIVVAMTGGIASIVLIIWGSTLATGSDVASLAFWAVPLVWLSVFIALSASQAQLRDRFVIVSVLQVTTQSVLLLASALAYASNWDVVGLARAIAIISTVAAVAVLALLVVLLRNRRRAGNDSAVTAGSSEAPPKPISVVRGAWPYAVTGGLFAVFFQIDVLFLGRMRDSTEVAIYVVAVSLVGGMHLLPAALNRVLLLPRFQRWASHDRGQLKQVYKRTSAQLIGAGVVGAVALVALAPFLIPAIFGNAYAEAAKVLAVLSLAIPLRAGASSAGAVMSTRENIRRKALLMAVATLVNIVANIVLIPLWGMYGAAVGTVLAEGMLFVLYRSRVRSYLDEYSHPADLE